MFKKILFGSVCALAMGVAGSALADGFVGNVSADGGTVRFTGLGSADTWGVNAAGATAVSDMGFSAQVDGGYHKINIHGFGDVNDWDVNGSLFALVNKGGRIGATVGYNSLDGNGGGTAHVTNYGIFGEWWASDDITAGAKVGGFDGNIIGSGYYAGGNAAFYITPDLSLGGALNYSHFSAGFQETDYTGQAEYLFSETMPISVVTGYTYSNLPGTHGSEWFLAVKFYCNGDTGAATLVDRQRAGGTLNSNNVGAGSLLASLLP